ncbi:RNA polymerase subunit sigma-24 [Streptomyces actinomycinicus]|uniref:RNA polymerase subunit sigma-24 n=1 Tax=Streptomyces actinomycinicus TaxID=1695166 RepID=A0A937EPZ8_9ACTN|nr:sigma factor-like helix-turn-helix DNA-binding protein [Streptomyces actinomycinicus]MBL1087408.1 RNA polymerase subunit sigma-24 [Streptomyces actinomycinicus]
MSRIEEFETLRPLLFSIAYRILGDESDAEYAVREARRRYDAGPVPAATATSYLPALVTRISTDVLRAARSPREKYPGPWPPEPLLSDPFQDLDQPADLAESLSTAAVLLLERLSPLERAFFVLREIFGCDMSRIAAAVGCSRTACHQLADAVTRASDGDGAAPPWPDVVVGSGQVARVLAAIVPALLGIGVTMEPQHVHSRPGAVFRDRHGTALSALTLDFLDGRIQTIRWVSLPPAAHARPVPDQAS